MKFGLTQYPVVFEVVVLYLDVDGCDMVIVAPDIGSMVMPLM